MKLLSILLSFITITMFGQTTILDNSNISGSLTVANSPYIIEGRATVPVGQTLTIEPGVEVKLKSSASYLSTWFDFAAGNVGVIRVKGNIIANGTSQNPIIFTRNNTGNWGAILLDENTSSNSSFLYCIVEYANETRNVTGITSVVSFDGGISVYKSNPSIVNTVFRYNRVNGLYIVEVSSLLSFSKSSFYDNGANGLVIELSVVNAINNKFFDNSLTTSGSVSAIRSSGSTVYLVGNLIYNNDDFGIYTKNNGNNYLINNTIYGNFQGIRVESGANTYIYNSIIQNNTTNFATSSPGGAIIELRNSMTNPATLPSTVADSGGNLFNSNAFFTNITLFDFSLQNNSSCIDNGNVNTAGLNLPIQDILGNPRIDNNVIDIGATEFQHPIIYYNITTTANPLLGGTTTGDGAHLSGTNVTVTATANAGYIFLNWKEGASIVSTDSSYTFVSSGNRNLVANFQSTASLNASNIDKSELLASPNPTKGLITIDYDYFKSAKLFSIDGKFINEYPSKIIDITNQKEGLYFLQINSTNGENKIIRILKL
jgi:parallel beta-helix repeat protein